MLNKSTKAVHWKICFHQRSPVIIAKSSILEQQQLELSLISGTQRLKESDTDDWFDEVEKSIYVQERFMKGILIFRKYILAQTFWIDMLEQFWLIAWKN